jgi:hypothetical protein
MNQQDAARKYRASLDSDFLRNIAALRAKNNMGYKNDVARQVLAPPDSQDLQLKSNATGWAPDEIAQLSPDAGFGRNMPSVPISVNAPASYAQPTPIPNAIPGAYKITPIPNAKPGQTKVVPLNQSSSSPWDTLRGYAKNLSFPIPTLEDILNKNAGNAPVDGIHNTFPIQEGPLPPMMVNPFMPSNSEINIGEALKKIIPDVTPDEIKFAVPMINTISEQLDYEPGSGQLPQYLIGSGDNYPAAKGNKKGFKSALNEVAKQILSKRPLPPNNYLESKQGYYY